MGQYMDSMKRDLVVLGVGVLLGIGGAHLGFNERLIRIEDKLEMVVDKHISDKAIHHRAAQTSAL